MKKKVIALALSLSMVFSLAACGGNSNTNQTTTAGGDNNTTTTAASNGGDSAEGPEGTLVIGTLLFNGVFSPFFYNSAYDHQVFQTVFSQVSDLNENNELVDVAGHVEAEEVTDENGNVQTLYTVSVKEDMTFSDGEPVTIDDVIFYYKVVLDPAYDGMDTTRTSLAIVGANEYYYDDPNYTETVSGIEAEAAEKAADKDAFIEYLIATELEGWWDNTLPGDLGGGMTWADYLTGEGYDPSAIAEDPQAMLEMLALCEYEHYADSYDAYSYYVDLLSQDYIAAGLSDGIDVPEISGITRVDDYTCTVLVDGINILGERFLGQVSITPEHYYGENFTKGDLSGVKAKSSVPMGSGPFVFESYENNVVTQKANPNYFKGCPKIEYLKYQVIDEEQKLNAIISGEIDITDPSASLEIMEEIEAEGLGYSLIGNPGYGYIAISAKRIPDKNVREGLMHLMTREQAIATYYGELAQVIERPMTPTLGEYPQDAEEYWGYDPAKALECFQAAGYEQVNGVLQKDGKQLVVEVGIGDAISHPSTPILTQMANDMETMGAKLIVTDADFSIINNRMQNDDLDMWVMAWGNATNCDLTQLFGSASTQAGGSNRTWIQDAEIDALMSEVMQTLDFEERKALVAKELDLIMSWATYMPVYQRQNLLVYNSDTINMDTIPANTSTYYNYVNEIEKLELN